MSALQDKLDKNGQLIIFDATFPEKLLVFQNLAENLAKTANSNNSIALLSLNITPVSLYLQFYHFLSNIILAKSY